MDRIAKLLGAGAIAFASGCGGTIGSPSGEQGAVLHRTFFDFAIAEDRQQFEASDIEFEQSAGPWAVYRVTGSNPQLIGPLVSYRTGATARLATSMCYTNEMLTGDMPSTMMYMQIDGADEATGSTRLAEVEQAGEADCTPSGEGQSEIPVPGVCNDPDGCDTGSGGPYDDPNSPGHATPYEPIATPYGQAAGSPTVCNDPDGCSTGSSGGTGDAPSYEQGIIYVVMDKRIAPAPGSRIYLRHVDLDSSGGQSDGRAGSICCSGDSCTIFNQSGDPVDTTTGPVPAVID